MVAGGFVLAAAGEAVVLHHDEPGPLVFGLCGAPLLAVLATRRVRPALPISVIAIAAACAVVVQTRYWPGGGDGGGVWLLALLFAAYSVGRHGTGRTVGLGVAVPAVAALVIDVPTMHGWALLDGVVFLTIFVGALPALVGRTVHLRHEHLARLDEQRAVIVREQARRQEAAALAERLRATERLQPRLLDGLTDLAARAEGGADPVDIEHAAQRLLGRTREEVLALAGPIEAPEPGQPPEILDHVRVLRAAAQPWVVLAAGSFAAALALESTRELQLRVPAWGAVVAAILIAAPLALLCRRPLLALCAAWCAAIIFSRVVAPLDGSLGGTTFSLTTAFAAALLLPRGRAIAALALCCLGQVVGIGATDPIGEVVMIAVCWLGGRAVGEASRLLEQGRANMRVITAQDELNGQRAVIGERLRLAREVHDQVGHTLTVVALQAAAARRLALSDPGRVQPVMATIAQAAREGRAAIADGGSLSMAGVLDRIRATGLDLDTDSAAFGDLAASDAQTYAVATRVVQEALTNVLRHAPGSSAAITTQVTDRRVSVVVRNSPSARPGGGGGTGRGLEGLRDQIAVHGGELSWGRVADGGFEVRAALPVRRLEESTR